MSAILYSMVHEKAKAVMGAEPVSAANYKKWVQVWLATCLALADEMKAEGLVETSAALRRIYAEQNRINDLW